MTDISKVPIEAVVFDYGEVISEPADPVHMANMARITGIEAGLLKDLYWKFRDEYDRGTYAGAGYWREVGRAAGCSISDDQVLQLVREDVTSWSRVRAPVLAWTRELSSAGIKTAVLSNMMSDLLAHMRDSFDWLNSFAFQSYSCEIGSVKPEEKIYRHVLEGLRVVPDRALFLDDREANIKGAQAVGMRGLVFSSMKDLKGQLKEAGFTVPAPES